MRLKLNEHVAERYRILGYQGIGGSATIHEAWDLEDERRVALKSLNMKLPAYQAAQAGTRFMREAAAMAAIDHPNVGMIFDFGVLEDRCPYLVMELLDGVDLAIELARGAIDPVRTWRLVEPVLCALGIGHERGIIHKDLKPSNLFLRREAEGPERLMILDFGLACFRKARRLTMPGFLSGTPAYMPPEYIHHNIVTAAFDVYQMGLVLVEMLSGSPVVVADSARSCFEVHTDATYELPCWLSEGPIGAVLARALDTDHTHRYCDGFALRDALAEVDFAALTPRPPRAEG